MVIKNSIWILLIIGFLFLCFFGAMALKNSNSIDPVWIEEFKLGEGKKKAIIDSIDQVAALYSLQKETVDGPGKLEGRPVYFFHYKVNDRVVITVHDLKGGGDTLTTYYYGLDEKSHDETLSSDIKMLLKSSSERN